MRSAFLITSMLSLSLMLAACARTQPIYNVAEAPVVTASSGAPRLDQVRSAIITACREKEWFVNPVEDGLIVATAHVRQHTAVVDIHYTPTSYSITYKDSDTLLYDGEQIHRNYNKWVKLLAEKIDFELNKI
ncbi:hypothetical protein [Pelagibius sp. 7325]|uniref:hypothetical protein n=1 Tax=Pelagibius sp. 7325 TaxID=3131994 RepID=UPI0030EF45AF